MGQDTAGGDGGSGVWWPWHWRVQTGAGVRTTAGPAPRRVLFLDWCCQPGSYHHHHHRTHTPCTVHKHPVLYTLYTTHPVLYTLYTTHPVLYTLYTKHPVLYAVYSVLDIVYTKQTAIYPILYNVYNKLNTLYVHTGLGRQDILSLDTGHHGKTDNLGTFAAEVTWHIFAMCSITEHHCAEDNTV